MNMKTDQELLDHIQKTRNISDNTLTSYKIYIQEYSKVNHNMLMVNLIKEAETEEEAIYKAKEYLFECNDFEVLYETAVTEETELEDLEGNLVESW